MRVLKVDLFRTRSIGDLVQNNLDDLYFRAGDPGDAPIVQFNLRCESSGHELSPGFSIRQGRRLRLLCIRLLLAHRIIVVGSMAYRENCSRYCSTRENEAEIALIQDLQLIERN